MLKVKFPAAKKVSLTSSSSSSTKSAASFTYTQDSCEEEDGEEEEEEVRDVMDTLYDTDNESINEDEEPEYTQCKPLEEKVDFFQAFGHIPNVDNVSEDISVASIKIERPKVVEETSMKDAGKFVDPLTGGDMQSSEESKSTDDEADEAGDEMEEEKQEGSFHSDDIFLPDDSCDDDEDIKKTTDVEDTLQTFLELESKNDVTFVEEIDWEAVAREQEAKRIEQHTLDLIAELINQAVEKVEYVTPESILRNNLDKRLLLQELHLQYPIFTEKNYVLQFLNRKAVEYFRRKKSFRAITQDNIKTATHGKLKFKDAIQRLDHLLEKESKLKSTTSDLIENLQNEYAQAKEEAEAQVQQFASMVKTTLFRENNAKPNALIDLLLSRMNRYRREVNEVRFQLLSELHNKAQLTEALTSLENLGNGLSMRDFGCLQAETQTLGKKIEERNAELNKLHIRCHSDIHSMAHFKEKQKMLRNIIMTQRSVFRTVLENKHSIRENLHMLKLRHKTIRNQISHLSFQGGLLDKPVLMLDYDATVERLKKQTVIIEDLRRTLLATQHKIDEILKNCPELEMKREINETL